jgi:hypothetical protein
MCREQQEVRTCGASEKVSAANSIANEFLRSVRNSMSPRVSRPKG